MMVWIVQAWGKDSPNVVPMAQAEFRSFSLAEDTARFWKRQGFRIEKFVKEAA